MPPVGGATPLTLLVVGGEEDLAEWRGLLDGRLVQVRTREALAAQGIDSETIEVTTVRLEGLRGPLTEAGNSAVLALTRGNGPVRPAADAIAAIAHAKREWETALDAVTDAVVILSPDGLVLRANRAFPALLGSSFAQTVGQSFVGLVGETASETLDDPIARVLGGESHATGEVRFASLPGVFQATATEIATDSAGPRTVVATLQDVTEAKDRQRRQELAHRLAEIGRLAGGVAHEISTPLASIALRAESLLNHCADTDLLAIDAFRDFPRYLRTIEGESFRCKRIIAALLDFSRPRFPSVVVTDINALVETAVALAGDQARAHRVTLETHFDSTLPMIPVDPGQIREAVMAVLLNALDASAPGGTVSIETSRGDSAWLCLRVRDSGEGIAPENLGRVFVPFFTTKPAGQAVGLGLSISDGILRAHGGDIRIESTFGVGTTATLLLPLRQRTAATTTP